MKNITKKIIPALLLSTILGNLGMVIEAPSSSVNAYTMKPLQGSIVVVPAGTPILVTANMEISSEYLQIGQNVVATITQDFYYNNTLVAPLGSSVNGKVTNVRKSGRAGVNGQLEIKFTNIITPYGQMIPITAVIQTDDNTGFLRGGTKTDTAKEYAKDVTIGAATGALAGVIFGPISDGTSGKGAAYGTAIGAGLGLAKSLWDKGEPVVIPVGASFNIIPEQQITFTPQ